LSISGSDETKRGKDGPCTWKNLEETQAARVYVHGVPGQDRHQITLIPDQFAEKPSRLLETT
jgi:hypothetical protein